MMCGVDKMKKEGFYFLNVSKVNLHNVSTKGYDGAELHIDNVKEVKRV